VEDELENASINETGPSEDSENTGDKNTSPAKEISKKYASSVAHSCGR